MLDDRRVRDDIDYLKRQVKILANGRYQIGDIYITTDSTEPAQRLGYGTWEAFGEGRVLVGLDSGDTDFDTSEETGGSKTHTLTISEMPSHSHTLDVAQTGASGTARRHSSVSPTLNPSTNNTGGGDPHNNLQPYIVVYMWKRIS